MGRPSNTWINELMSSFRRSFVKSNLESSFLCANHMHGCLSDESSGKRNQRETIKWLSPCVSSSLSFHLPIPPVLLAPHSPRSFTPSSLIPPPSPPSPNFSLQHCSGGFHGNGRARAASWISTGVSSQIVIDQLWLQLRRCPMPGSAEISSKNKEKGKRKKKTPQEISYNAMLLIITLLQWELSSSLHALPIVTYDINLFVENVPDPCGLRAKSH